MKQTVYIVIVYRYGDHEVHSLVVGVYSKKHKALKVAEIEDGYRRGAKYRSEVLEMDINDGN